MGPAGERSMATVDEPQKELLLDPACTQRMKWTNAAGSQDQAADEPNSHIGKLLADKIGHELAADVKACYVSPPVGGFFEHPSTTLGGRNAGAILKSHWKATWTQEGTRKEGDTQVHRMLCRFTQKGPAHKIEHSRTVLPDEIDELKWKTRAPQGTAAFQCGEQSWHRGEAPYQVSQKQIRRHILKLASGKSFDV